MPSGDDTRGDPRQSLSHAKLQTPALRAGMVRRDALLERLLAPDPPPLVCAVAPGGYGKTTALAQWAGEDPRPFAWLTLDRDDNDVIQLARGIEAALHEAGLLRANDGQRRRSSTTVSALQRLVASVSVPFVLVLDDVQALGSTAAQDLLAALSRSLRPQSQLVLSGRREPVDVLAASRAAQQVLEIGTTDLALSTSEGRALLSAAGLRSSDEVADGYVLRAEGWAAGVYLMALARQGGAPDVEPLSSDRFVEDYLWTQHLAALPREQLTFLLQSSVLDQVSGELCDSILEREGSASLLDQISRSNLFLVPLDHERRWYRYHDLFRAVLRRELGRTSPGSVPKLQRKASDWCLVHGLPEGAMNYALSAGDTERMARVIVAHGFALFRAGRLTTIAGWLEHFQEGALLERHPQVAVIGTITHANLGKPFQAERWLDAAARAAESAPPPPDGSVSLHAWVLTASALLCREGPARMRDDAERALAELGPLSPFRPVAMWLRATALLLQGNERAEVELRQALDATTSTGATFAATACSCQLAALALERGDVEGALSLVARFEVASGDETFVDYPALAWPTSVEARIRLAAGDGDGAARLLIEMQRLRPSLTHAIPFASVHALAEMADAYIHLGEPTAARAVLVDATEMLKHRPKLGILGSRIEQLRLRAATEPAAGGWELSLTAAELRLLPLLTTHLSFPEIGQRLFISRNTVKTQAVSIYRKLDANSRTEAVERAAALGLVEVGQSVALGNQP